MSTEPLTKPPQGYKVAETDTVVYPQYIGYLAKDASWFILRITGTDTSGAFRYTAGKGDFDTNWTGRAGLTYLHSFEVLPEEAF